MINRQLLQQAERATQRFQELFRGDPLNPRRMEAYIRDVLPLELQCVASDDEGPRRLPDTSIQGGILVQLVGFSLEPLLQSICAYKPAEVVLILNQDYGDRSWETFGREIERYVSSLPSDLLHCSVQQHQDIVVTSVPLDKDYPEYVFQRLRQELMPRLRDGKRLVLDITGGKKSMVSGAFFFGAFAGVDISYVDFDEYDPERRMPLGYTCRIGLLANPYQTFRLRDWERVRELYQRYAFRSASALLGPICDGQTATEGEGIIDSMHDWFTEKEIIAAQTLRHVMDMYALWDNGDYCGALAKYKTMVPRLHDKSKLQLPTAVSILGVDDYWPSGDDAGTLLERLKKLELYISENNTNNINTSKHRSLYLDISKLLVYVHDELAKVERLIKYNEDYRSALLRAVGLTEVLLRARFLILLDTKNADIAQIPLDEEQPKGQQPDYKRWADATDIVDTWKEAIFNGAILQDSVFPLLRALQYRADGNKAARRPTELTCYTDWERRQGNKGKFSLRRINDPEVPILSGKVVLGKEQMLRNKAIHTYLSVPYPVAEQTLRIACDSVDEFIEQWVPLMTKESFTFLTKRLPWEILCEACGLTFLPSANEEDAV